MLDLRILGEVGLQAADGGNVDTVLNQPRRFALLVYLAVRLPGSYVGRDALLPAFWPEASPDAARQSLRQALHFLRRELGADAFLSRGRELGVNPDVVRCDAVAFLDLVDRDPEAALRLHRGDLLPGFHCGDSTLHFDQWLETQRSALRRAAANAAFRVAESNAAAGEYVSAGAWGRRAAELMHADEVVARRVIALLDQIGDRAGALSAYETLRLQLHDDLGVAPGAETRNLVAALLRSDPTTPENAALRDPSGPPADEGPQAWLAEGGKRGPVDPDPNGRLVEAETGGVRPWRGWQRPRHRFAVAMLIATLLLGAWTLARGSRGDPARRHTPEHTLLYVDDLDAMTADGESDRLAGMLRTELLGHLAGVHGLEVIGLSSVAHGGTDVSPAFRITGTLNTLGGHVRAAFLVADARSGVPLTRVHVAQDAGTAFDAQILGAAAARQLRHRLGQLRREEAWRSGGAPTPALELVRRAAGEARAADSLHSARAGPAARTFARGADSLLAVAVTAAPRWSVPARQRAHVAARVAWYHLFDPTTGHDSAHHAAGRAVVLADQALRLDPHDPHILEIRGVMRHLQWMIAPAGTPTRDLPDLNLVRRDLARAVEIDPGLTVAWNYLSRALAESGDYLDARLAAERAYRADTFLSNGPDILVRLVDLSLETGDLDGARKWCAEVRRQIPARAVHDHCTLSILAWTDLPDAAALAEAASITDAHISSDESSVQSRAAIDMLQAVVLARAGAVDAAEAAIERAHASGSTDGQLHFLEAWIRIIAGEHDRAERALLKAIMGAGNGIPSTVLSRRFETIRDRPEIELRLH